MSFSNKQDTTKDQEKGPLGQPLVLGVRREGIVAESMGEGVKGIEKWKIGKFIGGGAEGMVYKALNVSNGVLSAVKKVHFYKE